MIHQIQTGDIVLHGPEGVRVIPPSEAYYSMEMLMTCKAMARQEEFPTIAEIFRHLVSMIEKGGAE